MPVRAYPLCIIAGIGAGVWLADRRWRARGGQAGLISEIALWAVPFGIAGARFYHDATDPELYFTAGKHPIEALYIWRGGLGIWGGVAAGALGAWIACRRRGIRLVQVADVRAPALPIAQAIGRLGNYFNQELYGRPSGLGGTGTRSPIPVPPIAAALCRIRSTGRRARPTARQVTAATTMSSTGSPAASRAAIRETLASTCPSEVAT